MYFECQIEKGQWGPVVHKGLGKEAFLILVDNPFVALDPFLDG